MHEFDSATGMKTERHTALGSIRVHPRDLRLISGSTFPAA